mmetsp:Transcript_22656/g.31543  ORF Transcript_22656/g.31543 Transcript_22656/m.31543 type:complete len:399 (-) Transcript_22656:12-1208(-)
MSSSSNLVAPFEFATATQIIFGNGTIQQIGTVISSLNLKQKPKALIVCGKNKQRTQPLLNQLEKNNIEYVHFSVPEEPTTDMAVEGTELGRSSQCNLVIGFGGGSSVDTGKAIAALLANEGDIYDYLEVVGKAQPLKNPSLPYIAIPTTAGTGSEVTRNAVLCSLKHKQKVSLRSIHMLPRVAIVDPELTLTVPKNITASTGLDAFTQVLEVFVSNKSNPITDSICREGLKRAARSLKRAYDHGETDKQAREDMAVASLFGGIALANAKLGAVHGFAGPLGGMYEGAPHGAVCAALLPHVIQVNVEALTQRDPSSQYIARFDEVAQIITGNPAAKSADAVTWIKELCQHLNVAPLSTYGVKHEHLEAIVDKSMNTSSMQGNPIKLTKEELTRIVSAAI